MKRTNEHLTIDEPQAKRVKLDGELPFLYLPEITLLYAQYLSPLDVYALSLVNKQSLSTLKYFYSNPKGLDSKEKYRCKSYASKGYANSDAITTIHRITIGETVTYMLAIKEKDRSPTIFQIQDNQCHWNRIVATHSKQTSDALHGIGIQQVLVTRYNDRLYVVVNVTGWRMFLWEITPNKDLRPSVTSYSWSKIKNYTTPATDETNLHLNICNPYLYITSHSHLFLFHLGLKAICVRHRFQERTIGGFFGVRYKCDNQGGTVKEVVNRDDKTIIIVAAYYGFDEDVPQDVIQKNSDTLYYDLVPQLMESKPVLLC